jgi:hypothetical protein
MSWIMGSVVINSEFNPSGHYSDFSVVDIILVSDQ